MEKRTQNQGFTLIEMLVTVAVFSVLMTIVGAIFVQTLDLQRIAFNLQTIEENSRFALEVMAKEIRFGEMMDPSTSCPGNDSLSLTHPVNGDIVYSLLDGRIHRNVNGIDTILTGDNVNVTRLSFCVSGTENDDGIQPRVTILMSMETGIKNPQVIDLQTTITSRLLDVL
jgi:prepilin-type N-terminal cleavage/methylation domain-containing protein